MAVLQRMYALFAASLKLWEIKKNIYI